MSIVNDTLKFGQQRATDLSIATHVPYLRHIDEQTVVTKNGMLASVIKLSGLPFQTMDQEDINARLSNRNTTVRSLGSSRFALYSTIIRRRIKPEIDGSFDIPFADELDSRYMSRIRQKTLFVNEIYLTVIRRPMQGRLGAVEKVFDWFKMADGTGEARAEALQDLRDTVEKVAGDLKGYRSEVLSVADRNGTVYSELAEFFAKLLAAGDERQMPLPRMSMDSYVGTGRLFFGKRIFEVSSQDGTSSKLGAMISIKDYPPYTTPGQLDGLLALPHELIITHSFAPEDRTTVVEMISKIARQIANSDDGGTSAVEEVEHARDRLSSGEVVFGKHHMTVAVYAPTVEVLNRAVVDVTAEMTRLGLVGVREDLNQEAAFWAQLPCNFSLIGRGCLISSWNFAGLFSAHNFPAGQTSKLHWKLPISLLETTSQTAYYFNFHETDVGHTTIIGPTGSGKTVLMTFLIAQMMRVRPRPRCIYVDKDNAGEIFVRAMGGRYESLRKGVRSGFAPFQLEDTPTNRAFCAHLLGYMLAPTGGELSPTERSIVSSAVERFFSNFQRSERKLELVSEALKGSQRGGIGDLADRLKEWTTGDKGWLFNNDTDQLDFSRGVIGLDMTDVLKEPRTRTAAMLHIQHRISELFTGEPFMIVLDEGWLLLDDPVFSHMLKDWLKTIRKLNGVVVFGTQSVADIIKSEISSTIVEQTKTNIFFPNAKAERDHHRLFSLSEKEFRFVKETDKASRTFLVKHDRDSIIARLDLSTAGDLVRVLSGQPETVRECAELRQLYGDEPEAWLPHFCGWEGGNA